MDHLPDIENAEYPPDRIQCFVNPEDQYCGPSLEQFPRQKDFVLGEDLGFSGKAHWAAYPVLGTSSLLSEKERASFMQAWLFFGPLTEVCAIVGIAFNATDFTYQEDGQLWITTRPLQSFVEQWKAAEDSSDTNVKESHSSQINNILELASMFTQYNLCTGSPVPQIWSLSKEVVLSIQILGESLRHAWASIYSSAGVGHETGGGLDSDLPDARMKANGWCTSEIAMLQHRLSVTGRYFASRLRRHRPTFEKPHNQCTEAKCYASHIDNATYVTQHTTADCTCRHLRIDPAEVVSVLERGCIPRVRICPSERSEDFSLTIEDAGDYVAISHVWAHGLGNAMANSLPMCQLLRLHQQVSALGPQCALDAPQESSQIWIDTLCVPVYDKEGKDPIQKGKFKQGKLMALEAMRRTYQEAVHVLVLDEELQNTSAYSSLEEVSIRISCSAWSRRLWTFEEGMVSWDRLWIQYREKARRYADLQDSYQPSLHCSLRFEVINEARRDLPRTNDVPAAGRNMIAEVTDACKYRTTSHLIDESFCLASVAGLDVGRILAYDTAEERMIAFLLQVRDLPSNIICFTGPRLQSEGFRWAPASFLYPQPSSTVFGRDDVSKVICTEKGLQGDWAGYELTFPSTILPQAEMYYFEIANGWIAIRSIDLVQKHLYDDPPDVEQCRTYQSLQSVKDLAVLLPSSDPWEWDGVVVSYTGKGDDFVQEAVIMLNVLLDRYETGSDVLDPDKLDPARCLQITAKPVPEQTMWRLT